MGHEPPSLRAGSARRSFGRAGGARGWVVARAGFLGCSCYLGLGSTAPAPRFLGTQPPCATQALNEVKYII